MGRYYLVLIVSAIIVLVMIYFILVVFILTHSSQFNRPRPAPLQIQDNYLFINRNTSRLSLIVSVKNIGDRIMNIEKIEVVELSIVVHVDKTLNPGQLHTFNFSIIINTTNVQPGKEYTLYVYYRLLGSNRINRVSSKVVLTGK